MRLLERIVGRAAMGGVEERFGVNGLVDLFAFGGHSYGAFGAGPAGRERVEGSFPGLVQGAVKRNGIIFGAVTARAWLFAEVRFAFRDRIGKNVFGGAGLELLERPAPNLTTGEMLTSVEIDASIAGNAYWARRTRPDQLRRLRPDWVEIVVGSPDDDPNHVDAAVAGFVYHPGGIGHGRPVFLDRAEVAHYAPEPDPLTHARGMSWLTPIIQDIEADIGFTEHRRKFVDHGATPPFAVKYPDGLSVEKFKSIIKLFDETHTGSMNAWKVLHLAGGADPVPLGVDLKQLDYKAVQALGETRISVASRVPAVVLGISEGLAGSSLNAGNYGMARRQLGDGFLRPCWRMACGAFDHLVAPPNGQAELWYDASEVSFLHEDEKDAAEVTARNAEAMRTLTDAGYKPETVVEAVVTGDLSKLQHTGTYSVQLQPPGSTNAPADAGED